MAEIRRAPERAGRALKALVASGWELVTVDGQKEQKTAIYLFKRRLSEELMSTSIVALLTDPAAHRRFLRPAAVPNWNRLGGAGFAVRPSGRFRGGSALPAMLGL